MTLVFLHIPKTAGATFSYVLQKQYDPIKSFYISNLYPEKSIEHFISLSEDERASFDMIQGHHAHLLLDHVIDPVKITFLRDPVKQFKSIFKHIKNSPHNPRHQDLQNVDSLEEFLVYAKNEEFFNLQTYSLSHSFKDLQKGRDARRKVTQEDYKKALDILNSCDYVLITEEFDHTLLALSRELKWDEPNYIWKNKRSTQFGTNLDREILELQHFDLKLYKEAKLRSEEFLDGRRLSEDEIRDFKIRNEEYTSSFLGRTSIKEKIDYYLDRFGIKKASWKKPPGY